MDKQKIKNISLFVVCIILTIIFFSYNVVICVDSSHYCWLASLIEARKGAFADWDVARGIVFPLIIYILTVLIGKNVVSLQIGMFIAYSITLVICYFIYKYINKEFKIHKYLKIILGLLAMFLIILNPLIIGYYHTILTEYIAMTACIVAAYFAWKWIDINFVENKIKYIIYTMYFALSTVFMWHLKQPYILTIFVPVIISSILSIIKKFDWKNVLQRIITILTCVIMLIISLKVWNVILESKVTVINQRRTSSGFLSGQIIGGMTEYYQLPLSEEYEIENILKNEKISEGDKKKIADIKNGNIKEYKNFLLIECAPYRNLENSKEIKVIYMKEENLSLAEALNFLFITFFENPKLIIEGYFNNYLTTIGLYKGKTVEVTSYVTKELNLTGTYENSYIAGNIYRDMSNNLNVPEYYTKYIENYNGINRQIKVVNNVMLKMLPYAIISFKVFLLFVPILFIISFIKFIILIIKKKENNKIKIYEILTILYGYSFLNVLMYSMLGSLIDRYAISSYISVNVAILIHFIYLCLSIINKFKNIKSNKRNENVEGRKN